MERRKFHYRAVHRPDLVIPALHTHFQLQSGLPPVIEPILDSMATGCRVPSHPLRSGQQCTVVTPPHRYAHRRVRRSIFRLPVRRRSWGMGNSCPARQNENRTAGSGGFICLPTGPAPPILPLARSVAVRRPPSSTAARKGNAVARTSQIPTRDLRSGGNPR